MKTSVSKSYVFFLVIALVAIIALGTGTARAQDLKKINVGYQPFSTYTPLFIMAEKGFLRKEGFELKMVRFTTSGKMALAVGSGDLDVGADQPTPSLVNVILMGTGARVVAGKGHIPAHPDKGTSGFVIRGDLADQIRTPAGLRGRTILTIAPGSPHLYLLGQWFRKYGFTENDVKFKYIRWPNMPLALTNKQADGGFMVEPFASKAVALGGKMLARSGSIAPGHVVGLLLYSGVLINKKSAVAQKFMNAYIKATRYFNDPANREECAGILSRRSRLSKELILKLDFVTVARNADIRMWSIDEQLMYFYKKKSIPRRVTAKEVVDGRFRDEALRQLGG